MGESRTSKQALTKRVEVRFSPDQYDKLQNIAKNANVSVSEIVRKSAIQTDVLKVKPRKKMEGGERELVVQVARAGNSLNQIARHCNTYKSDSNSLVVLTELVEIKGQLERLLDAYRSR